MALINMREFEEAKQILAGSLLIESRHYLAMLALARCHLGLGELVQARDLLADVIKERPSDQGALVLMSVAAAQLSQLDVAIDFGKRAIASNSRTGWPHFQLALHLLRAGQARQAIARLKDAVRILPRSPLFEHALGVAYAIDGQRERARKQFEIALSLEPGMSDAIKAMSKLLIEGGSTDAIIELLIEHLGRFPDDLEARELLAGAYFRRNEFKNARRQLHRGLYEMPATISAPAAVRARIANNLGACYDRLGETGKAERLFQTAIDWHAEAVPVAYTNLALVLLRQRRANEARELLDRALAMFPSNPDARHLLAAALIENDDVAGAISNLQQLIDDGHAIPETYSFLSSLLGDYEHRFEEAIASLRKGIKRFPNVAILRNSLAYEYLMNGETDEARGILTGLAASGTDAVYVAATNGLLKLANHDFEGGKSGYEEASRLARELGNERLAMLAQQKMHLELARAYIRHSWHSMAKREVEAGLALGQVDSVYHRDLVDLKESVSRI